MTTLPLKTVYIGDHQDRREGLWSHYFARGLLL